MDEQTYRHLVDDTLRQIDRAFEDVDPDLAESSISQGALTILYKMTVRAIVSPQPPVRQMWLAFRDRAWHFDWDPTQKRWLDDRGSHQDLFTVLQTISKDAVGVEISI